jgi:pSer/pThr/pTyr-binding forkhead associated (FHA) protein
MDEPLAVALKFGFLAVLYLFLLWVSRSALRDLARSQEPVLADPVDSPRRGDDAPGGLLQHVNPRLEVIAALGYEPGTTFDVSRGATLGRADTADIRVDDSFASSAHARVFERNDFMNVEDLASTNGTYLNGRKLGGTEQLRVGDVIRIGDSEYRYEE